MTHIHRKHFGHLSRRIRFIEPINEGHLGQIFDMAHQNNEAWRGMRVSSITDIILMKLLRVKQIEDNSGETLISEGVDANYQDMINYAVFALILMNEENSEA